MIKIICLIDWRESFFWGHNNLNWFLYVRRRVLCYLNDLCSQTFKRLWKCLLKVRIWEMFCFRFWQKENVISFVSTRQLCPPGPIRSRNESISVYTQVGLLSFWSVFVGNENLEEYELKRHVMSDLRGTAEIMRVKLGTHLTTFW